MIRFLVLIHNSRFFPLLSQEMTNDCRKEAKKERSVFFHKIMRRREGLGTYVKVYWKKGKQMLSRELIVLWAMAMVIVLSLGCHRVVTVYWTKSGAGPADLQVDKEECQALQRAVGLNEDQIEKCLEAQGWTPVREETETGMDADADTKRDSTNLESL